MVSFECGFNRSCLRTNLILALVEKDAKMCNFEMLGTCALIARDHGDIVLSGERQRRNRKFQLRECYDQQ
jgi:hypothetical protein